MPKGVKRIAVAQNQDNAKIIANAYYALKVDTSDHIWFKVSDWLPSTTEEEKKKDITWIRQTNDKKIILNQMVVPYNKVYGYKFDKKLCGNYYYYIEASLFGKRDFKNVTGIYISGYAPKRIISTKWTTTKGGTSIKNKNATNYIKYGHIIYLQASTEGLNGYKDIVVEVYNQQLGTDKVIFTYNSVNCINGEINLKIQNTSQWMSRVRNIQDVEQFYVKIKHKGKYIIDNHNDDEHAIYLNIKEEKVASAPQAPENITPTKVHEPQVNAARYEPCKFTEIKVIENGEEPFSVFKEGQKLKGKRNIKQKIHRTVFFDFNDYSINNQSQKKLNNILGFLLEHPGSTIHMSGYACVIGKQDYNKDLSQKRSDTVKDFFAQGGLDATRIISVGKGEYNTGDKDSIEHKNERDYIQARRVDISFTFNAHDAKALVYEMIAPSSPKPISVSVVDFEVGDEKCYQSSDNKHKKEVVVQSPDSQPQKKAGDYTEFSVQSTVSIANPHPLQYIWPRWNLINGATGNGINSAALYRLIINSCRYYSLKDEATVIVKAYPDVKWTLDFFLNLSNALSVKWMNLNPTEHKKFQKKAGKEGAENRWQQKDASFGFSLKSEWDKNSAGKFNEERELKGEYEAKFKKIYNLFSSIGALSDGITNKTKGSVRSVSPKGIPASFEVVPPNLSLYGNWHLEKPKDINNIVGTQVKIGLKADPLIGLKITIDLLGALVGSVAGVVSGGSATVPAVRLYNLIQGRLQEGIDFGAANFSLDIFMDLIIINTIKIESEFEFNTAGKAKDSKFKLEAANTLKVELKVGVIIKGEIVILVIEAEAYFEASAAGEASVTFGHGLNYDEKGLYYRPKLGFDGLHAKYIIQVSAGLAIKIAKDKGSIKQSGKHTFAEGEFRDIVPKFDVIEELENYFGIDANIPLIKND